VAPGQVRALLLGIIANNIAVLQNIIRTVHCAPVELIEEARIFRDGI
jgi:hypothetical protein